MGLYSRLEVPRLEPCEKCGDTGLFFLQFHYGAGQMKVHVIGSPIRWGSNDEGTPGQRYVEVLADPEPCLVCGFPEERMYVVSFEADVVSHYRLAEESDLARLDW